MIKKIILIFICMVCLFSCGKKDDPQYKAKKNYIFSNKV